MAKEKRAANPRPNKFTLRIAWLLFRGEITLTTVGLMATILVMYILRGYTNPNNEARWNSTLILLCISWISIAITWLAVFRKIRKLKKEAQEKATKEQTRPQ